LKPITICFCNIAASRTYSWKEWAFILYHLVKIRISSLATLSAGAGYLLTNGRLTIHMLTLVSGVFLLACGSCALNQYQEKIFDWQMERTKSRPIPSGSLSSETGLWISACLILLGSLILFFSTAGYLSPALGLFAVFWYNFIYTPLKRRTPFAVVPGALVGAIPPILGGLAGGGNLFHPGILGLALFFFIWQVPHFWILALIYSEDYEKAGFPSILKIFSATQVKRIVFSWILCVGGASLVLPLWGRFNSFLIRLLLGVSASWLFWNAFVFLKSQGEPSSLRTTFLKLNGYALFITLLSPLESILNTTFLI
jgi:heme o synthase